MKIIQIREMETSTLVATIAEKQEELANLKFQLSLHQLDNSAQVRLTRRDLARLITIKKERDLGIRTHNGETSGSGVR